MLAKLFYETDLCVTKNLSSGSEISTMSVPRYQVYSFDDYYEMNSKY